MSFQEFGACYSTAKAAAVARFTETPSQAVTIGTNCIAVPRYTVTGTDAAPIVTATWARTAGTCTVPPSVVVPYTATPCELIDTSDALQLSWLVVGVWVVAFGIRSLLRGMKP